MDFEDEIFGSVTGLDPTPGGGGFGGFSGIGGALGGLAIGALAGGLAGSGGSTYGDADLDALFGDLNNAHNEASALLAGAYHEAAGLIAAGQEAAAAAIIENSEMAVAAILESAQLADGAVREFWGEAKAVLAPIVTQGRFASDEMASMLGIRNSSGEVVPFNLGTLEKTPGYQFRFEQGSKAVANQAIGNYLSGEQVKAQVEFGQGLASTYFDKRVEQLSGLAGLGAQAAADTARAAVTSGGTLANVYNTRGTNLGRTYTATGEQLAGVHMSGAEALAGHAMAHAGAQAGMITDLASIQANLSLAGQQRADNIAAQEAQSQNNMWTTLGTVGGPLIGSSIPGVGTALGGTVGGALGGILGGIF